MDLDCIFRSVKSQCDIMLQAVTDFQLGPMLKIPKTVMKLSTKNVQLCEVPKQGNHAYEWEGKSRSIETPSQ